jgi:hypothetical protein
MLQVSNLLKKYLGNEYLPNVHWTSALRSNAGHAPYRASLPDTSTFTITDSSGNLTELLKLDAISFKKCPIFHIEVNSTELELHTTFRFDTGQYKKVYIHLLLILFQFSTINIKSKRRGGYDKSYEADI